MRRRNNPGNWRSAWAPCANIGLVAGLLLVNVSPRAEDLRDIELRRLLQPTEAELRQEAEGRIYIYDGLRDIDVEGAMDEQYQRIENMMFIRQKKTDQQGEPLKDPTTGEVEVEDDGC
jgi:hypothetical protein